MKKILKVVGAAFCGLMALTGTLNVFSPSEGTQVSSSLVLALTFLGLTVYLIWSISNDKKKKDAETMTTADQYLEAKKDEAERYYNSQKQKADKYYADIAKNAEDLKDELNAEIADLNSQLSILRGEAMVGMVRIDGYESLKSDEIKNELAMQRLRQDDLVKSGNAAISSAAYTDKKTADNHKKQILRSFNSECTGLIEGVTVKNVDSVRTRIQRSYDALNKIFAVDYVQLSRSYLSLKFEELSLVYAYMLKVEEEKEQRKEIRAQLAEEEKVRREIEREKQKLAKEETQFTNEVNKLMAYMQKAKDDVERQLYIDKIGELQEKLKALEADKENVLQREQNTRAGFVYIISNIGSFGEQIFKIGMTRRLEPMDRIAELSSASVPFPFDVHALIFSDDAPGLEAILHRHFDARRVNKVNPRKEFFKVDLDEIKKVVLENHNATVKFVDIPDATEYHETLKLEETTA